ncbi:MAG: N-acetylmuramoyl-L-alanine amidase [Candidatus Omnitrophota bacterium]
MKPRKLLLLFVSYCLLVTVLSGCVTTAPRIEAFPTYAIHGTRYLFLMAACDARGIDWRYDTYTRCVSLNKNGHQVNLRAGDDAMTIDGRQVSLGRPVEIYKGTVAVPYEFKKLVFDGVFKDILAGRTAGTYALNIKKVVVDAGHGGHDPGAIGRSGLKEKDVNLDIAKRLSRLLRSRGIEVVMTRSADIFIPLPRRVDIANNSQADFFISVHSNANRVRSMNGFEVYYVCPTVGDSNRALATAKSVPLPSAAGVLASDSLDLKAILWDMFYTDKRAESIELSRSLCWAMEKNLDAKLLGIKAARFEVLRGVRMPAVLVEVGFISNAAEERMLKNSFYRQKAAESLVQGIEEYAKITPLVEVAKR